MKTKLKNIFIFTLLLLGSYIGTNLYIDNKTEAATVYVPMVYSAPSGGLLNAYTETDAFVFSGGVPGATLNAAFNEPTPAPPIRGFVRRVFSAQAIFVPPACATNLTISLSGPGGGNGQTLSYRGHFSGTNGAFFPTLGIFDWAEVNGDLWSNNNGTGNLGNVGFAPEVGPGSTVVFSGGGGSVTAADLSDGITFSFWAETLDQLSNQTIFGVGRQFSFDLAGSPFLRVDYDDSACAWSVDAECTIDIINRRITYTVRRTSGAVPGNLNVALTSAPGSTGLATPVTLNDTDFNNASNAWQYNYNVNPPPNLGQSIVGNITVTPGGNSVPSVSANCNSGPIVARPYLRVYGGDTITGLPFSESDGTCTDPKNTAAGIQTYSIRNSSGNWVGSGSQFAASAVASIEGFVSASMHNGASGGPEVPKPTNDLSFGNYGSGGRITSGQPSGGDTKGYTGCIPDYLGYARTRALQQGSRSLTSGDPVGAVLWVKGDLRITGDRVTTVPAGGYDKIEDFQSFRYPMYVVEGNINIDPGVSVLTGMFIAVPDAARPGSGVINTCNNTVSASPLSACINKLTVRGALIANQVKFNRLNGDIVSAPSNEAYNSPTIAESIYFPPEMYLMYASDYTIDGFTIKGKYQSVVGLPPIL